MLRSRIIGCGAYLPSTILTNHDLATRVDTSDEWIVQRSGIRQRHVAAEGELTSDLALAASRDALAKAGLAAASVDLIVLATTTPDNSFPATATKVQSRLGVAAGGFAFDVQAVCSGFIYALAVADNFLRLGQARTALVIGAETFTRLLDWKDRGTCVLFGDGAGAVVLRADKGSGAIADRGVLSTHLHSNGDQYSLLYVDGGPSLGKLGHVRMNGREVFRHAVERMAEAVQEALAAHQLTPDAIDWLVPHQANIRIIEATARKLNLSPDKVVITVAEHANTSAASIPLALSAAVQDGRIGANQLVVMEAMGGGFTWGSAVVRM